MRVALIPARGGSKRIPRKNIKVFAGKPMLAWSIQAALTSELFDQVIVSTDDDEIANEAKAQGAQVPFIRPSDLSDDYTGSTAVIAHAIRWLQTQGLSPELVCCIYATAPFIRSEDLKRSLEALTETKSDYAFAITSYAFPIQRAIKLNEQGRIEMFQPENFNTRSQDLDEAYHDAGQFYWGRAQAWLTDKPMFSKDSVPIILPRSRVQDIDTLEDWERAEQMFKVNQNESK
jgi:N-acylneuraminate cytidylyltransferase